MKLSRPKQSTFWVSIILVVLGLLGSLGGVAVFSPYSFWLVLAGFIVLALGNLLKDL